MTFFNVLWFFLIFDLIIKNNSVFTAPFCRINRRVRLKIKMRETDSSTI